MTQETEIMHGRAIAQDAERLWRRDSLAGQERLRDRSARLRRFLGEPPSGQALEIGCGTGTWTRHLVELPVDLTCLEISEELLALARAKKPYARSVRFVQGDAERMPFPDAQFDWVCGVSILHHLRISQVLRELHRVLKPGGRAWFSEPNMLNPQVALQKNIPALKRWSGDTPDETAFFRWVLARQLREAMFSEVVVRPFDFLHPGLPTICVPIAKRMGVWMEKMIGLREIAGSLEIHFRKPFR